MKKKLTFKDGAIIFLIVIAFLNFFFALYDKNFYAVLGWFYSIAGFIWYYLETKKSKVMKW